MKIKYIIIIILLSLPAFNDIYSQTGKFSIHQTNDGSVIDVSIYVNRNSDDEWSLGFASLVFFYNNTAMTNPREFSEGNWDDNMNPEYGDQFFVFYDDGNSVSLEIGLDSIPSTGTLVSPDSALVGTVRFDILDTLEFSQLRWNLEYCAVLDNTGADITSNMIFTDPENVLLPVELVNFSYSKNKNEVDLYWITASEINNAGFDIERNNSGNGIWITAGSVPGKGNSSENTEYFFKDKNLQPGKYRYRLKQTDFNGNTEYFDLSQDVFINIPVTNFLSQNYPNPFNPNSLISYEVGSGTFDKINVRLTVYNTLGKQVATLVNENQTPGYYKINFNGSSFPSGIYIYVLEAEGNIIDSKRMILIK